MEKIQPERSWLKVAIEDAKRDISMLPKALQEIPPRSTLLEHAKRGSNGFRKETGKRQ